MDYSFWHDLRTNLSHKNVQSAIVFATTIAILAFFLTAVIMISKKSSERVSSPVLTPTGQLGPGPQLSDFKRSEGNLTLLGPQNIAEEANYAVEKVPTEPVKGKIVRISGQGYVRGAILKSRKGRDYNAFFKIPYARPPVGRYRFEVCRVIKSKLNKIQ